MDLSALSICPIDICPFYIQLQKWEIMLRCVKCLAFGIYFHGCITFCTDLRNAKKSFVENSQRSGFQTQSWGPPVYASFRPNHDWNRRTFNKQLIFLNYVLLMFRGIIYFLKLHFVRHSQKHMLLLCYIAITKKNMFLSNERLRLNKRRLIGLLNTNESFISFIIVSLNVSTQCTFGSVKQYLICFLILCYLWGGKF